MPAGGIPRHRRGSPARVPYEYLAVFLLSLAGLSVEIALTRILSLIQWYHFAFMVVSIALFGYGGAGTVLSLLPRLRHDDRVSAISAGLCCVFVLLSIFFATAIRFDPIAVQTRPSQLYSILLQYVTLGLPFLFIGICLAALVTKMPEKAGKLYFSDLTGAGIGCVFSLATIEVGGPHAAIVCSSIMAAAACLLLSRSVHLFRLQLVSGAGIVLLVLASGTILAIEPAVSQYKALSGILRSPSSERVWSAWNSISRVDIVNSSLIHHAPGLPYDSSETIPAQMGLFVDGDNLEPITSFDGSLADLSFMQSLPSSVAYRISPRGSVLIIDSGGGFDVLVALANGVENVTATEKNPLVLRAVGEVFGEVSGELYSRQDVDARAVDARSYLAGTDDEFDLVEISLKQDPVTASVGLYSLSENYLFTVEAFQQILERLTPDGVLVVTRWLSPPPRQEARVACIMIEALLQSGISDPSSHLASYRSYLTLTTLMKKQPFDEGELELIRQECRSLRLDLVHLPGMSSSEANSFNVFPEPYYYEAFRLLLDDASRKEFLTDYLFDVSPPTDERPFYYDFLKLSRIRDLREALGKRWNPYLEGGLLVMAVVAQASLISIAFLGLPLLASKRTRQGVRGKARWVLYFLCLGGGYLLVESCLLQKFILFLGQPAFAMAAILFAMLVFSGLGSLWSSRYEPSRRLILLVVVGIVAFQAVLYASLSAVFEMLLGSHIWLRFGSSIAMVAPLAFLMGVPFPTGLRLLGKRNSEVIPLAYSANGCASVIGSAGSVVLAGAVGFSNVILIAALVYAASATALPGGR